MLTIENIFPKMILSIYTTGINEFDFQFLLAESTKIRQFQSYIVKKIVSRNSSTKKPELKFYKFCSFSAFKGFEPVTSRYRCDTLTN